MQAVRISKGVSLTGEPVDVFQPFGVEHLLLTVGFLLGITALGAFGGIASEGFDQDGHRTSVRLRQIESVLGSIALLVWIFMTAWYVQPSVFSWDQSLPLHICDIVSLLGPLGLLTRSRFLMGIAWFWGVGLSSQGLVTPVVEATYSDMRFYLFWANHWIAVGAGLWIVFVTGYRPRIADLLRVTLAGVILMTVLFFVGWHIGGNYGYVGRALPERSTLLDVLGDWPWRAFILVVIGIGVLVSLWLPFGIGRRLSYRWAFEPGARSPASNTDVCRNTQ